MPHSETAHAHDEADLGRMLTREYWDERYGAGPVWSGHPDRKSVV